MSPPLAQARQRRRRDLVTLAVAAVLLVLAGVAWWGWNSQARDLRAEVLRGLPRFPSAGPGGPRRPGLDAAPAQPPTQILAQQRDRLAAFALAPAENLAVIQVNALLNTPLFARLRTCLPAGFDSLGDAGTELGLDLERDIDRVAIIPDGLAVSGTFGDRPLAARIARQMQGATRTRYRDTEIFASPQGGCVAQQGTLLLLGAGDRCERLVDRALDAPPPPAEGAQALESDLYARTDLSALRRGADGEARTTSSDQALGQILDGLGQLTLRANVWDEVAVSLEGSPPPGGQGRLEALAALARVSVEAGKTELADDPAWSALLEKARVALHDGRLQIDLALPADQLFDRLQLPCPGRDGGTW